MHVSSKSRLALWAMAAAAALAVAAANSHAASSSAANSAAATAGSARPRMHHQQLRQRRALLVRGGSPMPPGVVPPAPLAAAPVEGDAGGGALAGGQQQGLGRAKGAASAALAGSGWLKRLLARPDLGVRTASTLAMVSGFAAVIALGQQTGCAVLVALLQLGVFKEGMSVARDDFRDALLQAGGQESFQLLKWAVFGVGAFFAYGRLLCHEASSTAQPLGSFLSAFVHWHLPAAAALYMTIFLSFIFSLQMRQSYGYQLGQFAAAHFAAFICLSSTLVSFAMRAGMFWFALPSLLVIVNDIAAYLCGCMFGKTPLTALSPKKTWEGFAGAVLVTVAAGMAMAHSWAHSYWMMEPRNIILRDTVSDIHFPNMFRTVWTVPLLGMQVSRAQAHAFGLGMLVSLLGPFGGLFASAVKRAYGAKDFGNSIPGHGGVADRFDCQVLLLPLVYFYMKAFCPDLNI